MPDLIEKTDIEHLFQEFEDYVVPCEECDESEQMPAKWNINHGGPNCTYLMCDYHKQVLMSFLDRHPRCGHKHIHCKVCDQDFGPDDVNICPFEG